MGARPARALFPEIDRGDVSQLKEDVHAQGADPRVVQAHSDASRCHMVIRLVLELNQADGGAAVPSRTTGASNPSSRSTSCSSNPKVGSSSTKSTWGAS